MTQTSSRISKATLETEKIAKENNKIIADLRIQQKNAVENLDYDTAEMIENQIKEIRQSSKLLEFQEKLNVFAERLTEIVTNSYSNVEEIKKEGKKDQHQIRTRINNEFESLRAKQINELVSLEKDYASARLRETQRLIPEQEELLKKSKNAALTKDFDLARQYRDAAALVAETDLEARLMKTDNDFNELRKTLMAKQKDDIVFLSKKLDEELNTVERTVELKLQKEDTQRNVKVFNHFDKYQTSACACLDPNDTNARIRQLDEVCTQILYSINCPKPSGIGETTATNSQLNNMRVQNSKRSSRASKQSNRTKK